MCESYYFKFIGLYFFLLFVTHKTSSADNRNNAKSLVSTGLEKDKRNIDWHENLMFQD
jgi:hypothetical protein